MINLHGALMNVTETATNGVVNQDTIFTFVQKNEIVSARYEGGRVIKGFLAGRLVNNTLTFKYAQEHDDGHVTGGESICSVSVDSIGKRHLIENFTWDQGQGKNVFQEL
ncbi:MAG: hypothetical protein ABJF11_11155 [Reichenbachiella sp.]|uniref:hypothetical protein n=1 Tax=Reichenbachiella sp. TaxID=2184521 RepID=UPI00326600CA